MVELTDLRSFAWKCFVRDLLFLLHLAHLETPIQSTAVYFRAHAHISTIHHLSRCHRRSKHSDRIFGAFLSTNWHEPFFWAIDKLCGIQRQQIFLTVKCSCNIEWTLVPLMPKIISISRYVKWQSCNISWRTAWFPEHQLNLDDLHEIGLRMNYDLGWMHHTINKHRSLIENNE